MPSDRGTTTVTMLEVQKQKSLVYVVIREGFEEEVEQCGALGKSRGGQLQLAGTLPFFCKSNFIGTWLRPSFTYC